MNKKDKEQGTKEAQKKEDMKYTLANLNMRLGVSLKSLNRGRHIELIRNLIKGLDRQARLSEMEKIKSQHEIKVRDERLDNCAGLSLWQFLKWRKAHRQESKGE